MRDTGPDVDAAFLALFAERSPVERLKMTCAMFDSAKALIASDLRATTPDISAADLQFQELTIYWRLKIRKLEIARDEGQA